MIQVFHNKALYLLILAALSTMIGSVKAAPASYDTSAAVTLMYHRIGEDAYPSTNIRIDQFERHLDILSKGGFNVMALPDIVTSIKANTPLPPKTVAITIDDAYASVFHEAWPRLKAKGFPFTVFVSTGPIDAKNAGYMTWKQIRTLHAEGVTIGAHTQNHAHLASLSQTQALTEIAASNARFHKELGFVPKLFSYPYGEANLETINVVKKTYTAAFGQHSGVLSSGENLYFLPRFALNENYGDEGRFRLVINALPLPATDIMPANPTLSRNPPFFGFTVPDSKLSLRGLKCYDSSPGDTVTEVLGRRVEVRQSEAFRTTRGRINCTTRGPNGRWRWFGSLFYIPKGLRYNAVPNE